MLSVVCCLLFVLSVVCCLCYLLSVVVLSVVGYSLFVFGGMFFIIRSLLFSLLSCYLVFCFLFTYRKLLKNFQANLK